jgi:hypothetical protein
LRKRLHHWNKKLISTKISSKANHKEITEIKKDPTKSIDNQFKEALLTGQSIDQKTVKARELGKIFAKMYASSKDNKAISSEEMLRASAEMLKLMADLGFYNEIDKENNNFTVKLTPDDTENTKISINMMVGMFEAMGCPMSNEQIDKYQTTLTKLADFEKKITNDNQNTIEKAIALLQNNDIIESLSSESLKIFTPEQMEVFKNDSAVTGNNMFFSPTSTMVGIESQTIDNLKSQNEASQYVLDSW